MASFPLIGTTCIKGMRLTRLILFLVVVCWAGDELQAKCFKLEASLQKTSGEYQLPLKNSDQLKPTGH